MLEQGERSVCDLVNADGACSSPYQSNSKGPISFSRVSTVHTLLVTKHHLKCPYRNIATIFAEIFFFFSPVHSRRSLPAIVNTLKQFVGTLFMGPNQSFRKYQKINQSSGWSHKDNECQGGLLWSRPITTQLLSIHPSFPHTKSKRQMSYAISNKNFTQKGKKKRKEKLSRKLV